MLSSVVDADIHPRQRGSDHCPTSLHLRLPHLPSYVSNPSLRSSNAVASSSSSSLDDRLARIGLLLDLHPFPYPVPKDSTVSARMRTKFHKQGSLQGFFTNNSLMTPSIGDQSIALPSNNNQLTLPANNNLEDAIEQQHAAILKTMTNLPTKRKADSLTEYLSSSTAAANHPIIDQSSARKKSKFSSPTRPRQSGQATLADMFKRQQTK